MSKAEPRPRDRARDDLDELARLLPVLDVDVPAWRRRGRSDGALTDDEIEEQVFAFLHRRTAAALGESPPGPRRLPFDARASALRARIVVELQELELDVATQLDPDVYEHASTDRARIRRLRKMLRRLHVVDGLEEKTAARVAVVLGLARDALDPAAHAQLGACPWCGRQTLDVDIEAELIVCINPACKCTVAGCAACDPPEGKRRQGLHTWPRGQWEALAQFCVVADKARENSRMRADLVEWIRHQFAVDETAMRDRQYRHRVATGDAGDAAGLEELESVRARLDDLDDDQLRELASRYEDRPGYRQEWTS